jgi:hypothetical protein
MLGPLFLMMFTWKKQSKTKTTKNGKRKRSKKRTTNGSREPERNNINRYRNRKRNGEGCEDDRCHPPTLYKFLLFYKLISGQLIALPNNPQSWGISNTPFQKWFMSNPSRMFRPASVIIFGEPKSTLVVFVVRQYLHMADVHFDLNNRMNASTPSMFGNGHSRVFHGQINTGS